MGRTGMSMFAFLTAAVMFGTADHTQQVPAPLASLPAVIQASVPQYPRDAVNTGVAGTIRLKVATDGQKITSVELETTQPILDEAALRNVRTWRFVSHAPAHFDVTFRYTILDRPCESLGRDTHAAAIIHFPTDVEIFAERDAPCRGATPPPPVFGIYVKEASIPPYPAAARSNGIEGTVRIGVSAKGELTLVDGPAELGEPMRVAIRGWMLTPPPFAEEMRFTFKLVDGVCRGGPIVTIGPGLTTYDLTACR